VRPTARHEQRGESRRRGRRTVALICAIGLLLSGLASYAAHRVDDSTEGRLLTTQARQAAAVLSAAVLVIEQPLRSALAGQASAGPDGAPTAFRRGMTSSVGDERVFSTASLWKAESDGRLSFRRRALIGDRPGLDPDGPEVRALLRRALASPTSVVERIEVAGRTRIVYLVADPDMGFVVYAERPIPEDRRTPFDRDSAFAQLHYALYVGDRLSSSSLAATDMDPAELPLEEPTATVEIPFGDTVLTLVARPRDQLGSTLSQWLALIALLGGLVLTAFSATIARRLVGARTRAEESAEEISTLYERVDVLYEEQRELSLRLQRALLPAVLPELPGLEVASSYVAAAHGIEIGGDWYSLVAVDEHRFAFVVGDVSGHGIDAVAVMARARFTLRAYLLDGDGPGEALAKASPQFDIDVDDHMATVLVGVGDLRTGEMRLANAGHPLPVLSSPAGTEVVDLPTGPPLGLGPTSYETSTVVLPVGAALVAFTDGLVERRSEHIDEGTARLVQSVRRLADLPLAELVPQLLDACRDEDAADDIAVLALRRTGPGSLRA
jgi:serine phosphatase RsbU (regulator of sigma subunit)